MKPKEDHMKRLDWKLVVPAVAPVLMIAVAAVAFSFSPPPTRNCKACDEKCCPKTRNCSCLHVDTCTCITAPCHVTD